MRKPDKPVIIIQGDNNKVYFGETKSHRLVAIIIALGVIIGAALLAVSQCCPELLTDFVRFIISMAFSN